MTEYPPLPSSNRGSTVGLEEQNRFSGEPWEEDEVLFALWILELCLQRIETDAPQKPYWSFLAELVEEN